MPESITPPHRVLVISPHFPPVNAPDLHRIRQALPHLSDHRWVAEILTVHPDDVEAEQDPLLAASLPENLTVHRVRAFPASLTRRFGFGNLAWRAYSALRKEGNRLLAAGNFDLVFFSTSIFGVLPLGPYWKKRYGIPYVVDFQDPWVYEKGEIDFSSVPGGRCKYAMTQWQAHRLERQVIQEAAHVIAVSPGYIRNFLRRYPSLPESHYTEMPFGGAATDQVFSKKAAISQQQFTPGQGMNWVYAGISGPSFNFALRAFFLALKRAEEGGLLKGLSLHLHFLGTDYGAAGKARKKIEPVAREYGVEHLVTETPYRLPYFTTLACLRQADALIIPGSQSPTYSASKIYPYILAEQPLLALFQEESSSARIFQETQAATLVTFKTESTLAEVSQKIYDQWFLSQACRVKPATDWAAFSPYTSTHLTGQLAKIFHLAVRKKP